MHGNFNFVETHCYASKKRLIKQRRMQYVSILTSILYNYKPMWIANRLQETAPSYMFIILIRIPLTQTISHKGRGNFYSPWRTMSWTYIHRSFPSFARRGSRGGFP